MTRDFARNGSQRGGKSGGGGGRSSSRSGNRSGGAHKKSGNASRKPQQTSAPWTWFLSGLLCGVFLSGLVWLASQQPDELVEATPQAADTRNERPQPRFDFYTLLPEQRIDVDVDPDAMASTSAERSNDEFLLQAGSFKQPQDADRRRAELLLLGLDASVEEANTDNGRWFRVYIGPFDSRSKLQSARSVTAQQGIDTLLLKRPGKSTDG